MSENDHEPKAMYRPGQPPPDARIDYPHVSASRVMRDPANKSRVVPALSYSAKGKRFSYVGGLVAIGVIVALYLCFR